jgi:hypothetical protein
MLWMYASNYDKHVFALDVHSPYQTFPIPKLSRGVYPKYSENTRTRLIYGIKHLCTGLHMQLLLVQIISKKFAFVYSFVHWLWF